MNREIKFRQRVGNRWHYWGWLHGEGRFTGPENPSDPSHQFTGLYDKKGREIYEGDIVKHQGTPWYHQEKTQLIKQVKIEKYHIDPFAGSSSDWHEPSEQWEIIGNIFENTEIKLCE